VRQEGTAIAARTALGGDLSTLLSDALSRRGIQKQRLHHKGAKHTKDDDLRVLCVFVVQLIFAARSLIRQVWPNAEKSA
jgi:hypothetical protein